jgi:hypothetical protein
MARSQFVCNKTYGIFECSIDNATWICTVDKNYDGNISVAVTRVVCLCNGMTVLSYATEFNVSYLKIVSRLVQISRLKHAFSMTMRRNNYNLGILMIGIILQIVLIFLTMFR